MCATTSSLFDRLSSLSLLHSWVIGLGTPLLLCWALGSLPATAQQLNRVGTDVLQQARTDVHGPDRTGKDGPLSRVGLELALLYREHQRFEESGGESFEPQSIPTPSTGPSTALPSTTDEGGMTADPSGYISPVRGETVVVDAIAADSPSALTDAMERVGAENVARYKNLVSGRVPIDRIPDLAAVSSLQSARPAHAATRSRSVSPRLRAWLERKAAGETTGPPPESSEAPLPGSAVSEGGEAMNTDDVGSTFSIDGSGIKVGVLSDSYNTADGVATTAEDDIASGDLPPDYRIEVLEDYPGGGPFGPSIDEGRAMMQLIHDVAPGADLAFHTATGGRGNFAQGILDLADAGAEVTVDDIFYFAQPFFQDGPVAQAVNAVFSQGVPHFSSAGNDGAQSYESDSWSTEARANGTPMYDFDPTTSTVDTSQTVVIGDASQFGGARFIFQWDDPAASASPASPGADTDLDLLLYQVNEEGDETLVASSTADNIGGDPVEILQFASSSTTEYELRIVKAGDGPTPGRIKYIHNGAVAPQEYETNSSTLVGHPNATDAAGVAAAYYQQTPPFGTDPAEAESFTSLGGTPILFSVDGSAKSSAEVRDQPRFTGPDGTSNTFFGGDRDGDGLPNFSGTSASAPHVAALAALQKQADPSLTPAQIYADLASGAEDMLPPTTPTQDEPPAVSDPNGFDLLTGAGFVNAQNTITSATGPADISVVTPTTIPYGQRFFDQDAGSLFDQAATTVEIVNTGNAELTINSVSISSSAFAFASGDALTSGALAPSERATGTLLFSPGSVGSYSGTVTIESDDPDESTVTIDLSGEAILPPVASVSASSLFEAVETGNTVTRTISVFNTGDTPLEYDVFAEALGLGPFTPSDVVAPPTTGSNAKSAASTELEALPAPATTSAKQAFDVSDFIYTLDDGSAETSLGIGSNADVFWLNAFEAQEGATTITAIASAFGSSQSVGSSVEFLLYEDPNDDGDPTDANLLRTVPTTTEVSGGSQLQIEPIPPTQVDGVFFVAVLVPNTANFPAPLDQSSDQGASWTANTSPGSFNPSDLSQNSPSLTSDIGVPGNWVLRAQGAYAAFDPVSGTVAAGNADNVDVTFDGASLPTGRYQANAAVTSNDPATPRIDVPFTFFVADAVGEASLNPSNTSTAFDDGSPISPEPGLVVDLSDVSGSGTVTAMRFDDPPANVSGLATGESASEYRWFVRQDGDLTFDMQSEIRFRRADIPDPGFDATTADDVTVYRRASFGSGTFSDLTSDPDDGGTPNNLSDDAIVATGATAFSEFIFGSDTAPLPVEIASFDATRDGSAVTLSWQTASETNNAGFRLERKAQDEDGWTDVGSLIEGGGTTTRAQTYRHRVEGLSPTTYRFRLKSVSTEGTTSVGPTTTIEVRMESAYAVSPVRPNPVPERGRLTVQVREKQDVRVALYNVLGQAVRTLHDGPLPANTPRTMAIDGSSLASGVYFVRVQGETFQATRKITLAQ